MLFLSPAQTIAAMKKSGKERKGSSLSLVKALHTHEQNKTVIVHDAELSTYATSV